MPTNEPPPAPNAAKSRIRVEDNGCWTWTGHCNQKGYGRIEIAGVYHQTHRIMYQIFFGQIPSQCQLHHTCQNPACCNPAHLVPMPSPLHARITNAARRKQGRSRISESDFAFLSSLIDQPPETYGLKHKTWTIAALVDLATTKLEKQVTWYTMRTWVRSNLEWTPTGFSTPNKTSKTRTQPTTRINRNLSPRVQTAYAKWLAEQHTLPIE